MIDVQKVVAELKKDRFATEQTGIVIDEIQSKYSKCSFDVKEHHLNAMGAVMGGAIFTLADFTFAVACNCENKSVVSISSTVNFLRAARCKRLVGEALCIKDGRSTCVYEVTVTDECDNKIAVVIFTGFVMQ